MSTYSAAQQIQSFSHVGICVSNIERSKRFYCEGLGFVAGPVIPPSDDIYHELLGIPEKLLMHNHFLQLGNTTIELIQFDKPALVPGPALRPINQIGLTHLSLRVVDIDVVAKALEALGGKILHSTRTKVIKEPGDTTWPDVVIFCQDPDGTRIELISFPKEAAVA